MASLLTSQWEVKQKNESETIYLLATTLNEASPK